MGLDSLSGMNRHLGYASEGKVCHTTQVDLIGCYLVGNESSIMPSETATPLEPAFYTQLEKFLFGS